MEFGVHLPLISFAGEQRSLDELLAFTEAARDLGYTHLCANDHLVFSRPWLDGPTALAAVLGAQRSDDARDDRRRAGAPWTGSDREDPRGDRPAVRRPAAGRARPRFVCSGLRAGRRAIRGALEAAGRGGADAARVLASRRRRVRGCVLLHCRLHAGTDAGAAPRSTDLDRELGIGGGAETRGAPCRWLARLRLQHDPGAVRSGLVGRPGRGGGTRARCCAVPERHRNDVVLRHRGPGTRRRRCSRTCWRRCSIVPRSSSARYCRSVRRRNARRSCWRTRSAGAQRVFLWPLADERAQLEVFRERVVPLLDAERA